MRTNENDSTLPPFCSLLTALLVASGAFTTAASQAVPVPTQSASGADSTQLVSGENSVWNAQRVVRVLENGTRVLLGDGTVWEVYLPDRPSVDTWRPGDLLIVRERGASQGDFDYSLKDPRRHSEAAARLAGEADEGR